MEVFRRFLELALAWDLPAIVHLRDKDGVWTAYEDGLALLTPSRPAGGRFVVHCFSGTPAWAEKFLALGACLGVTGLVTFNRADNIRETLAVIPDDRLLIETDSPYLAPVPHRGVENHPGFLVLIAARVAAEPEARTRIDRPAHHGKRAPVFPDRGGAMSIFFPAAAAVRTVPPLRTRF